MTQGGNKVMLVIGILLIVAGAAALIFGGIPQDRDAIEIGQASIGITETESIPQWLSILGIVVGAVLAWIGFSGKK
ncbi:MAG TPA: hypothetical protein VF275_11395 [Gammaproteobacteria bacterium]